MWTSRSGIVGEAVVDAASLSRRAAWFGGGAAAGVRSGRITGANGSGRLRVAVTDPGRLDGVSLVAAPELSEPLAPGHVRVSVRAAGMNSAMC
jgi:hypothetical protein